MSIGFLFWFFYFFFFFPSFFYCYYYPIKKADVANLLVRLSSYCRLFSPFFLSNSYCNRHGVCVPTKRWRSLSILQYLDVLKISRLYSFHNCLLGTRVKLRVESGFHGAYRDAGPIQSRKDLRLNLFLIPDFSVLKQRRHHLTYFFLSLSPISYDPCRRLLMMNSILLFDLSASWQSSCALFWMVVEVKWTRKAALNYSG